jgi:hypothetical protein
MKIIALNIGNTWGSETPKSGEIHLMTEDGKSTIKIRVDEHFTQTVLNLAMQQVVEAAEEGLRELKASMLESVSTPLIGNAEVIEDVQF